MKPALLLVDLQGDFLDTAALQPPREILVRQAARWLQLCRAAKIPVIHVWTTLSRHDDRRLPHWKKSHRWRCVAGTDGHKTPPPLQPRPNERVAHKTGFNGFAGGALDDALRQAGCDTVIVAGLHLHTCVRAIAAESLERHLRVWVAGDAVASDDPILAAGTRRWLAERCVEFLPAGEALARLRGRAPAKLIHRSPRDKHKPLFAVPIAGGDSIPETTASAQAAWKNWRRTPATSRCQMLERVAARLEKAAPALARQMALQLGKPVSHAREEVRRAAANIRDVSRRVAAFDFAPPAAAGIVRHAPLGVIALISPWNNPVAIPLGKIAPALAYGNVVVWKPAPAATKISQAIWNLLRAAGVPPNAVQLLTGDHTTAQKLAADENVDAVTITSSATAGFAIQEICARRFLPLQAELNGNNAAIVWDDADLPAAARQIAWGAFGFAGQRCTANRRVIVAPPIFEKFWHELRKAAEKLPWGDPLKETTEIGPVLHAAKAGEHLALIQAAEKSGAARRVAFLFKTSAAQRLARNGAYARPAMIWCDEPEHWLVQEETMSPLLVVQRANDFAHALKLCNGVRHGLAAALFSRSAPRQKAFLASACAGILKINSTTAGVDVTLPFGGWKMSGLGPPEHGEGDRLFYTRLQAVYGMEPSIEQRL